LATHSNFYSDPQELNLLKEWFSGVDQNNSGEIDEDELSAALRAGGETFSKRSVKAMISLFDSNHNGQIDLQEFGKLFRFINHHREVFDKHRIPKTEYISKRDLQSVLKASGLNAVGEEYYKISNDQSIATLNYEQYLDLLLSMSARFFEKK